MGFTATMIFYLLIGLGVAVAVFLADSRSDRLSPAFRAATALVFWPLYLPILLAARGPGRGRKLGPIRARAMSCR